MLGVSGVYRRSSGIYAIRLVVPCRLRSIIGSAEIHVSTGLREANAAKIAALRILLHWRDRFAMLDLERLTKQNPILFGDGFLPLEEAARAIGLTTSTLLAELRGEKSQLFVQAQNWRGWSVADLWAVERDEDDC